MYHVSTHVLQLAWVAATCLLLLYQEDLTLQLDRMFPCLSRKNAAEGKHKVRANPVPQKPRHPSIDIHSRKTLASRTFFMPSSDPHCNSRQVHFLDGISPKTHLRKSKLLDANEFSRSCVNAARSFWPTEDNFDSKYHCDNNGLYEEGYSHGRLYCKNSLVSVTISCGCIAANMAGPTQENTSEEKPSKHNYFANPGIHMRLSASLHDQAGTIN
ncbi:hypothetical protein A7U60_g4737 [Sanghuangporus baumii]|uniref:Uncharacterized protein n=1 Tax=Sanghuangporus baumii TaxID=108892 RepID=A0A9Q5N8U2_SANBA|nr:hypothetical protein A7U60_g4737 [Sanghuangporus baumii]